MSTNLDKINSFISEHHVMSLATTYDDGINNCSLFYAYSTQLNAFVVASSDDTNHIRDIKNNAKIAGNIFLETKTIGKIRGLQFKGEFLELHNKELTELYFKTFPYARALVPKLWQIKVSYFKMTDNRLGFGKKIIWEDSSL
jgi:uncharacterized protein